MAFGLRSVRIRSKSTSDNCVSFHNDVWLMKYSQKQNMESDTLLHALHGVLLFRISEKVRASLNRKGVTSFLKLGWSWLEKGTVFPILYTLRRFEKKSVLGRASILNESLSPHFNAEAPPPPKHQCWGDDGPRLSTEYFLQAGMPR